MEENIPYQTMSYLVRGKTLMEAGYKPYTTVAPKNKGAPIAKKPAVKRKKSFASTLGNKGQCYYCNELEACTRDHFYPKSKGGTLTVWACGFCQRTKSNMLPEVYVEAVNRRWIFSEEYKKHITNAVNNLYAYLSQNNIKYKR